MSLSPAPAPLSSLYTQAAPNDDPQKKALGELDSQLAGSLAIIRKELENDFAPKLTFEESVAVLKKRIIDLEYKFMKRKNDVRTCMCAFINAETSTNKQINALNTYIK